ncbi:MAG: L,D-transpeptidase family protein [Chakrabartia sp.]
MTRFTRLPRALRQIVSTAAALSVIGIMAAPVPPSAALTRPQVQTVSQARPQAVKAEPAPPALNAYVIKRALVINEPIVHGFWTWDDAGVPNGPVVITVDTAAQTMSVFRAGYEIGVAVILYGADEKPTPLGIYPITQKKVHHISNLYGAPMPYMQRLTNDGISIHASDVADGWATHGCIGVPRAFAKLLFAETKLGDLVIVTSGERLAVGGAISAAN